MTDTVQKDDLDYVDLKTFKIRPDQEYRRSDKEGIQALATSIEKSGLIHNIVTDPDGFVCSGTRRVEALRLLKWKEPIPRRVVSKELADAIVLAANYPVENPDPLEDSAIVEKMVKERGWTVEEIALTIGWSTRRVVMLKQLQNLCPEAQAAIADPGNMMHGWPITWVEEFCLLPQESQRAAIANNLFTYAGPGRDKRQFDRVLQEHFHVLGKAPWDVADATLVPEAGSCTACPKQSGHERNRGLFDSNDGIEETDVKKFTCLDAQCWLKKSNACATRKIVELREKNRDSVIVVDPFTRERLPVLKEHPTFMEHQVSPCAKSEKGAIPALFLRGDGSMERKYVRKPAEVGTPGKPAKPAKKAVDLSPAEKEKLREEKLLTRRQQWVINDIIEKIREDKVSTPDHMTLQGFVAAYRVDEPRNDGRGIHGNVKVRKELFATAVNHKKFDEALWARLKPDIILSISGNRYLDEEFAEAIWVALKLGMGSKDGLTEKEIEREFMAAAMNVIPSPKLAVKATKPKGKGKKPAPKKKRARAENGFQPESDDE